MAVSPPPGVAHLPPADDQALWDELRARPTVRVPVTIAATTQTVVNGVGILIGWAFREIAAQATTIDMYDGRDATGDQLASTTLAASGSQAQSVGVAGCMFQRGLTITANTGTIKGAVWVQI